MPAGKALTLRVARQVEPGIKPSGDKGLETASRFSMGGSKIISHDANRS